MNIQQLPIHSVLTQIQQVLSKSSAVLAAPPGSGKTTIVPLSLLQEKWLREKKILILEPRRLAARAAAARMASLLGEKVGQTVGYQIRLDRKISNSTKIEVVTEGVLTRRIQVDPGLDGVGLVIFDEFHERSIHADLAMALCLDLCSINEDLRLLVMSATLDAEPIAELLGEVPIITAKGESFPVEIEYLDRPHRGRVSSLTVRVIHKVLHEKSGDILVFLPGVGEIKEVQRRFQSESTVPDVVLLPLYGAMRQKSQDQVILPDPHGRRRIILATSIAETSLSIEGINSVIDSGLSRRPRFQPENGLTRLITQSVSKATARQRTGRAGRFGPGYCLRLWTQQEHYNLVPFDVPEILSVDLAGLVLELALWGVSEPEELKWLDSPRSGPYRQAQNLLISIGALTRDGRISRRGRGLASLPLHPRLAHMIQQAEKIDQVHLACDIAAILSERDLLGQRRFNFADVEARVRLLHTWRDKGNAAVLQEGGDPVVCSRIEQVVNQWKKQLVGKKNRGDLSEIGNLLVFAYPDRVARRRSDKPGSYLLASGRGAVLPPGDLLGASEYLVAPHMDAGKKEGKIYLAAPLVLADLKNLHSNLFTMNDSLFWDDQKRKVVAHRSTQLGAISIEEKPLHSVGVEEIRKVLLAGIQKMGISCLPWTKESKRYQARMEFLKKRMPGLELPDISDQFLIGNLDWLAPYLDGLTRASQLEKLNLLEVIKSMLSWQQQKSVEQHAPDRMTVSSGSKIRITYQADHNPILAVRIQEMYGATETPTICRGQVPLLLHLLSPAQRPIQITSDLKGFWERSYPEIIKELKGRYPKHYWPDDPVSAVAIKGVKRKM